MQMNLSSPDFAGIQGNTPEIIADIIRKSIFDGTFKAGQPLRQDQIAQALKISKIPIREALVQLKAEGLVVFLPNRGALVSRLSQDEVKEIFSTTSLATIYKTVILLKHLNEVLELGFPDGSNRYDGNQPYPHPHIICTRCKRITDPDLGSMTQLAAEAAQKTGYEILDHRLDFFGICPECQEKT